PRQLFCRFGECRNWSSYQFGDEQREPGSGKQNQGGNKEKQQDICPAHCLARSCKLLVIALALGNLQHRGIKARGQGNGHDDNATSSYIALADCVRELVPAKATTGAQRIHERCADLQPGGGDIDRSHGSASPQGKRKTTLQCRLIFVQGSIG